MQTFVPLLLLFSQASALAPIGAVSRTQDLGFGKRAEVRSTRAVVPRMQDWGFGKSGAGMKGADVRGNTKIVKDLGGKSNSEFDRKMAESDAKNNKNIVLFVGIPTLGLIALLVAIASQ